VGGLQAYRRSSASAPSAAAVAGFLLFTPTYPDSVAASVGAVRDALLLADLAPRSSDPVLRLSRILADLGFRAGGAAAQGSLRDICESVGSELALATATSPNGTLAA